VPPAEDPRKDAARRAAQLDAERVAAWLQLSPRWIVFFVALLAINVFVARHGTSIPRRVIASSCSR
jgi:intracellular septation protein A